MSDESKPINREKEIAGLHDCLNRGDNHASVHLARLIESDTHGTLQYFAQALAARLCDHLNRHAELGITDPYVALEDAVYSLMNATAIDWDGIPRPGRPGEEA